MLRYLSIFLLAILPVRACYWDRDTLEDEAKNQLDVVKAITGWFDRYPPKYYEMRLERVAKELAIHPEQLDLYDDAGVACSRLNRHDEAIAWMAKKKSVLDHLPEKDSTEARYRYLSNLGTFHLVRWMAKPEQEWNADLADLRESDSLIARALEINPDAHFGREKFQLMLIRWLLNAGLDPKERGSSNFLGEDTAGNHGEGPPEKTKAGYTFEEATKGITGLIQLGAAWQSVDTALALQTSLGGEHKNSLARLAWMRRQELLREHKQSLHPVEAIRREVTEAPPAGMIHSEEKIDGFYVSVRQAADRREAAWLAYQEARFAQGMHPDTHPDFWKDWREPAFPKFPNQIFDDPMNNAVLIVLTVIALIVGAILWRVISFVLRRRKRLRMSRA